MKCQVCKSDMELVNDKEVFLEFTLFKQQYTVLRDVKSWLCFCCASEAQREDERGAYEAGMEDGYERARADYQGGRWE